MTTTVDILDSICEQTISPTMRNALHACRPGHPLNSEWQWRNAHALAAQHHELDREAVHWLAIRASIETMRDEGCDIWRGTVPL
jgi:hypothetical protein